jgi:ABC-type multidrug transport system permease subunit
VCLLRGTNWVFICNLYQPAYLKDICNTSTENELANLYNEAVQQNTRWIGSLKRRKIEIIIIIIIIIIIMIINRL